MKLELTCTQMILIQSHCQKEIEELTKIIKKSTDALIKLNNEGHKPTKFDIDRASYLQRQKDDYIEILKQF